MRPATLAEHGATRARQPSRNGVVPRVLHVATIPMSTVFLRGQVGYMKAAGFEVHVLTSPGEDLVRFGREEGVAVHAVPMARRITPFQDMAAVAGIVGVIRRIGPDIVHGHTPKGGLLGMVAATIAGVPRRIYQMRGLPMLTAHGPTRRVLAESERLACRLAHRVLCNSHSLREIAVQERLCPASKIDVLCGGSGNGVDADGRFNPLRQPPDTRRRTRLELGIPTGARVVGFVGRLVRDKGVVELVDAWAELRERYPDLHLLLVGPFEPRDPVPAHTRQTLDADPRIHLAGMDWDTPAYYAAMDVVTLPSHREGLPNVPLEAASMERPVVCTLVPGCVDAVADGETGILVSAGDAPGLAAALARYLDDPELRTRHGRAGREWVLREFRQEAIWEALRAQYEDLLGRRKVRYFG